MALGTESCPLRSQKPSSLSSASVSFSVRRVLRGMWETRVLMALCVAVGTMPAVFYRHTPLCASLRLLAWVIRLADMNIGVQISPESLPPGLEYTQTWDCRRTQKVHAQFSRGQMSCCPQRLHRFTFSLATSESALFSHCRLFH